MLVRRAPVSRLLDRFMEDVTSDLSNYESRANNEFSLALDVTENDDAYIVEASVPGVNADDIDISMHDDVLTISAETNYENNVENARAIIRERRYGKFSRSIRFPLAVDADNIDAEYTNGILRLSVPKAPETKPRRISVKTSS